MNCMRNCSLPPRRPPAPNTWVGQLSPKEWRDLCRPDDQSSRPRKPGKERLTCPEPGRGIRRSSGVRRSGSPSSATSRSEGWRGTWESPTSRCVIGSRRTRPARGERPGGLSSDEREELQRLRDENATCAQRRSLRSRARCWGQRSIATRPGAIRRGGTLLRWDSELPAT